MNQELIQMLRELKIYNSIENVFAPDHNNLVKIYEKFCDLINGDENYHIDNPAIALFYKCKIMCRTVGIPDFQMMDLNDPDIKRTKTIVIQLCKYCFWQRDVLNKWEKRNKEIVQITIIQIQLEDIDIVEAKRLKAELEDTIVIKRKGLEMNKKRFETLKNTTAKMEIELQSKLAIQQKLQQSLNKTKNELMDAQKKERNLQEKLKAGRHELCILETQIVREPKVLEQKAKESKRRVDYLQKEVAKYSRDYYNEQFKKDKIYKVHSVNLEFLVRKLKVIQENLNGIAELKKNQEKYDEQLNNVLKSSTIEGALLKKLLAEKECLLQQKSSHQLEEHNSSQYSFQNLIDLQKQLQEIQAQVKQEQQNYSQSLMKAQDFKRQQMEMEQVQAVIEGNLKAVITNQIQELVSYTSNVENLINNIDFE